jgi:uncharacterized pyridoxal phosphate-containing UPF0001 family protein
MPYSLAAPQEEKILRENYFKFLKQAIIQSFLKQNGTICLACNGRPVDDLFYLGTLGHITFGEKYVQEGVPKLNALKVEHPQIKKQYFGKLQTNKIKVVLNHFDTIESVASKREIDYLVKYAPKIADFHEKSYFLEVNLGEEPQKNGVFPKEVENVLVYAQDQKLPIAGLMTIPPKHLNPTPFFKRLRSMADQFGLKNCQMGFSKDYKEAIDCGSTHLRIGRLVFAG